MSKKQLGPGVWLNDDGSLSIDVDTVIKVVGLEITEANQRIVMDVAMETLAEHLPKHTIIGKCVQLPADHPLDDNEQHGGEASLSA